MRIQWKCTGEDLRSAWKLKADGVRWETWALDFLKDKVQAIYERGDVILCEGIGPGKSYEMRFGDAIAGAPERSIGEPMKQEDQLDRVMRVTQLKALFDSVFFAAIHSGLLVDKAVIKASEAVEHVDAIEGARSRVVSARMEKEFSIDAP